MINVALPADLEKRVNETVERGEYASREKFFEEAAELLLGLRNGDGIPVPAGGACREPPLRYTARERTGMAGVLWFAGNRRWDTLLAMNFADDLELWFAGNRR